MAAARYWRLSSIRTHHGGGLILSRLELNDAGGRADIGAVVTSTVAPSVGDLVNLADGIYTTICGFDAESLYAPGFSIVFDLGSDKDIVTLAASGPSVSEFLFSCLVQYSSDALQWTTAFSVSGLGWQGADILSYSSDTPVNEPLRIKALDQFRRVDGYLLSGGSSAGVFGVFPLLIGTDDGGLYRIAGTVKKLVMNEQQPLSRRVCLRTMRGGRVIRELWSDPVSGAYSFDFIKYQAYEVVAYDHEGLYRAVIADNIYPEPMQ